MAARDLSQTRLSSDASAYSRSDSRDREILAPLKAWTLMKAKFPFLTVFTILLRYGPHVDTWPYDGKVRFSPEPVRVRAWTWSRETWPTFRAGPTVVNVYLAVRGSLVMGYSIWVLERTGQLSVGREGRDGRGKGWERAGMGEGRDGRGQGWERAGMGEGRVGRGQGWERGRDGSGLGW
ncbi:hypothetical protein RRG08_013584 [Elysia crispata]|uniref:Uncharacterized protein n=1 Tax=Elysia crispata TaxID=231223 RepID=A0AAE1CRG8_9GAST|nr:hypothetical protein RRG08_013584 [Elysia crispata]